MVLLRNLKDAIQVPVFSKLPEVSSQLPPADKRVCLSARLRRPIPLRMHKTLLSKSLACMKMFKAQVRWAYVSVYKLPRGPLLLLLYKIKTAWPPGEFLQADGVCPHGIDSVGLNRSTPHRWSLSLMDELIKSILKTS